MDRTSIIILVICFAALILWYPLLNKIYPPKPLPPGATNAVVHTTVTGTNQIPAQTPAMAEAPLTQAKFFASTNVAEELTEFTNAKARFTFTSHGGGLKEVALSEFPETVSARRSKKAQTNHVATLNASAPAPTLAFMDGGGFQGDGVFALTKTAEGVRAEKTLTNGLSIVKDFQIGSNYLITTKVRLVNHSAQTLTLPAQEWVVGTATPLGPRDNGQVVGVMWYNGAKTEEIGAGFFATTSFGCVPRTPPTEFRGGSSNVTWAAVHNQFFALVAMPQGPAQALVARKVDLPRPTGDDAFLVATNSPPPQGYSASLVYPSVTLTPGQSVERQVILYAGPKEYQSLARLADQYNNSLDQLMNFGWSGFVSKALLLGMNWLHQTLKFSYGWAIVAITVIIKLIFWPLTQASTRSMKRMQALQPQLNAIKEKYKDDPVKTQRKMMELWKENKVSPMSGCLPMALQIPVFFGFLNMIRSAIELRGAPFLWVGDLSQSDTLFVIPGLDFIPIIGIRGVGLPFNLLPLIMGATMLWQARLTPPSPGMDPSQQAIMKYLPLIFLVGLYNFSAGLTLYWTVQNLLTIAQTKLINATPQTPVAPAPKPTVLTAPLKKRK